MIEGAVRMMLGLLAEVLEMLGFEKLSERLERKNKPDPRNFPPPR
ncbi:MAG: hypothetical protein R2725_02045 [Solirubrobacterales bacterium]